MTDQLTDKAVKAMLDGATPGPWRADGPPYNRIVWSSNENRICFMAHTNGLDDARDNSTSNLAAAAPALARALLDARAERDRLRADAQAAVALVVERAVKAADCGCKADQSDCLFISGDVTFCYREGLPDIRALADADGLAAVEALRKERDAAVSTLAYCEKQWSDTDRIAHAKMLDERSRADRLAAELAAAQRREAGLREGFADLLRAAHGLSFGDDWNGGTHAKTQGYRRMLLRSVAELMGSKLASPQASAALSNNGRGE